MSQHPKPSQTALDLHRAVPVVDLHADTLLVTDMFAYDMTVRHAPHGPRSPLFWHVDVPRLVDARVGGVGFGIVTNPLQSEEARERTVRRQAAHFREAASRDERLVFAGSAAELRAAHASGRIGGFFGIEGAHALGDRLDLLESFFGEGVRYLTLVHFSDNAFACPAQGLGRNQRDGLTELGRAAVAEMNRVGLVVDLAHINKPGFLEAARLCDAPLWVTHTGVRGAFDHWRNIDDDMLRAVAERDGCVGIIFFPGFLGRGTWGDLDQVVRHLEYVRATIGVRHCAIGTDMDGFISALPREIRDVADLPLLTDALLRAGWSDTEVEATLGGNALRVLEGVERRAATR